MFADRTNWNLDTNRLSEALIRHRAIRRPFSASNPSSPWRNPFFLSDGSDNGDSGSFEMDEAAEAKNKGLCYRHIGERLSSQESAKINDESRFLSSRGVPAPSKERKIRLRLNAPM